MITPPLRTSRTGNALVLTMIIVVGLASMLALSSDRVLGMNQLAGFNLRNQQVTYAAEAGASLVEGCIYAASGNNEALTTDIQNTASANQSATTWLNYMGYVGQTGQQSSSFAAGGLPNLWIGNCLVQWRIEPVTVYSQTYQCSTLAPYVPTVSGDTASNSYAPPAPSGTNQFLYNYQANPSLQTPPPAGALTNPGFYHYRIIATAYYMQDLATATQQLSAIYPPPPVQLPLTIANVTPWSVPQETLAVAQVERYVEIKLVNLFQYVIFYAATGPTGDIEFHPGPPLTITGAVQSNGSIYCGGNGTGYTASPGDYHGSANQSGQVEIGSSVAPVAITGYGGIFRMRKSGNYWFAQQFGVPSAIDPMNIPLSGGTIGGVAMVGNNDLNGDSVGSTIFQLNGLSGATGSSNPIFAGTSTNDSRGGLAVSGNKGYIKDAAHGASIVQTLSNFPQLAGYPFEYQQIVPPAVGSAPSQIYDSGAPNHYLTINPARYGGSAQPLYYTAAYGSPLSPVAGIPAYGSDLPLFWMQGAGGSWFADIWPAQPTVHTGANGAQLATAQGFANIYTGNPGIWPTLNVSNFIGINTNSYGYIPTYTFPNNYRSNILDTYLPMSYPVPVQGAAVEGYFLNESLRGLKGSGKTGLTIRERGTPNLNFRWFRNFDTMLTGPTGTLTMTNTPLAGSSTFFAGGGSFPYVWNQCPGTMTLNPVPQPVGPMEMVNAYVAMLEASYAVYLGVAPAPGGALPFALQPYDITASFFAYGAANAYGTGTVLNTGAPDSGLIATQDFFMNWREASWMQVNHYLTGAQAANYNIDALTLNIGNICSYLQNTTWASIDPAGNTGYTGLLNTIFNGIIYVQRTPRMAWWAGPTPANYTVTVGLPYYDPLSPLGFNPCFATNNASTLSPYAGPFASSVEGTNNGASYPVVGNASAGTVGALPTMAPGQPNVWSVYPSPKAVRLFNGWAINWGGVQPAAANRPQGLTVITPDPCYMWGNYNTKPFADSNGINQITPCAVYCDGLTDLSAGWVDNVNSYTTGEPNATLATQYICSVVINNLPTDTEDTYCGGSNGTHNVIRYIENWSNTWTFEGSLVVLNRMRYTRSYQTTPTPSNTISCPLSATGALYANNSSGGYYSPPTRVYQFNNDLLSSFGQPPASLSGISVQRVVSTVNLINK